MTELDNRIVQLVNEGLRGATPKDREPNMDGPRKAPRPLFPDILVFANTYASSRVAERKE